MPNGNYKRLPYLDSINQKRVYSGVVNKLKAPLRHAVNQSRVSEEGMEELIGLLEDTLAHIRQLDKPKRKKRTPKQTEEYSLPS